MRHEHQRHGQVQVVLVRESEIGFEKSQRFKDLLREYIATSPGPMVLCMEEVRFMDSMALSTLVAAKEWVHRAGFGFCLCSVTAPVLHVLRLTSLDTHLDIQPDLPAALRTLQ
jgi:anti-anti-sigma factor